MNYPYVYKLTQKETGQYYFGYREANSKYSIEDLGHKYFTSSKAINVIGFEKFHYEVLVDFIHPDRNQACEDAFWFEQSLIEKHIKDTLCLNAHFSYRNGNDRFKSLKGRKQSEETKAKIRAKRALQKFSEEHRLKMSEAQKGKTRSEEAKKKGALSNTGRKHSEESKQKMSDALKDSNVRERWLESRKGFKHTEESKQKMREAALNRTKGEKG